MEYRVGSGPYSTLVSNTESTATSYSHQGLTTNQVYIYRIYAITSFGTSQEASLEALAQPTSSSSATAPGAPTNLSATAVSPTQVNLVWSAPSNIGSSPITGYRSKIRLWPLRHTCLKHSKHCHHIPTHRPHNRHNIHLQGVCSQLCWGRKHIIRGVCYSDIFVCSCSS
jgi:hypothetical protein